MKKVIISKDDLKNNIKIIKSRVNNDVKIIAIVKANGMGLGLVEYSKYLVENGIEYLAVASYQDALELRENGIGVNILLMTPCIDEIYLSELIKNNITLTISTQEQVLLIEHIAEKENVNTVKAHIKVDTGFGRYGFISSEPEEILKAILNKNRIRLEGIYTHFSKPENEKWTRLQFERFTKVIEYLHDNGYDFSLKHCSASTAFLKYSNMRLDAIRAGSVFLGRTMVDIEGLKKIGFLKSYILEIKNLPKGYNISYSNTFKTKRETKIAVIPVGYMDGFNKSRLRDDFSLKNNLISVGMEIKKIFKDNSLYVSIGDTKCKVLGRLGMYHMVVDITGKNFKLGDEVTIDISPLQVNSEIRREFV